MAEFEDYTDQTRHNMTRNYSVITIESEQTDFFSHTVFIFLVVLHIKQRCDCVANTSPFGFYPLKSKYSTLHAEDSDRSSNRRSLIS